MRVRPDPLILALILGKEFADEGGGTESHSDSQPGGADSVFIPQFAVETDLPWLPRQIQKGSGYYLVV